MAKERELRTFVYDSVEIELPTTIRQGEHRKIERMTIQIAADDYTALQAEIGTAFQELERQQRAAGETASAADADDEALSDQEMTAILMVLGNLSRDDIDDIVRDDFLALKDELAVLYKRASLAEREVGKVN
jgi:tRNA threonylcarbamoyladenosine modification (KEOPS) complex  Pcc1 subunit